MFFSVADGFAITTVLYDEFINSNNLLNIIENKLQNIDINDIKLPFGTLAIKI